MIITHGVRIDLSESERTVKWGVDARSVNLSTALCKNCQHSTLYYKQADLIIINGRRLSYILFFMVVENWIDVVAASLQNLWQLVVGFLPSLIGAVLIVGVGLVVAAGLERIVERLIHYLKFDALFERLSIDEVLGRAKIELNTGHFVGRFVYWFMLIAFVLAASDTLGFTALSGFLRDVLLYIPNVLIAALIVLAAVIAANFLRGLVAASVLGTQLHAAKFLGLLTWWAVVIFGLLTAAVQLNIAVVIINTIITGVIAMLALAGGLAFGLGGRDVAERWLEELEDEVKHH